MTKVPGLWSTRTCKTTSNGIVYRIICAENGQKVPQSSDFKETLTTAVRNDPAKIGNREAVESQYLIDGSGLLSTTGCDS